jgi:hypothetical protein
MGRDHVSFENQADRQAFGTYSSGRDQAWSMYFVHEQLGVPWRAWARDATEDSKRGQQSTQEVAAL